PGQPIRRPELRTDIAFAMLGPILNIATVVVAIVVGVLSLAWLPGLAFRPVVSALPPPLVPVMAFVLFDLLGYWAHRWGHEVPALWNFHKVHHSTKRLDWVSGFRGHPLDGAFIAPPFFFLLAAGVDPRQIGIITVFQIVFGLFLHANVRWQLRPIQRLVATPEFHHWHHADERDAIHSNYSALFPVWDIVFGTYFVPKGRHPSRYGVAEELPTDTIGLLREPLPSTRTILRSLRHPVELFRSTKKATRSTVASMYRSCRRPTRR
ncbi:MAG: sterol desaturase family protein, partial [Acidimicrobiales bacterium]